MNRLPKSDPPPALSSVKEERVAQRGNRSERRDKIAQLPKETRDMINVMLEDGLPYHVLTEEVGEAGQGLSLENLAAWVQGRYQQYLKDRDTIEHAKQEAQRGRGEDSHRREQCAPQQKSGGSAEQSRDTAGLESPAI